MPFHVAEIRTEAVMQALALHSKKQHIPMPSKRTSAVYHPQLPRRTGTTTGTTGIIECVYEINTEICSNKRTPQLSIELYHRALPYFAPPPPLSLHPLKKIIRNTNSVIFHLFPVLRTTRNW